jgi:hypothetical protein
MNTIILCCMLLNPANNPATQPVGTYFLEQSLNKVVVVDGRQIKTISLQSLRYGSTLGKTKVLKGK